MKKFFLLLLSIIFCMQANAQFRGRVFSLPDSLALAGVSIGLPGGQTIKSDAMGEFSLYLPDGKYTATLSHLAYFTQNYNFILPQKGTVNIYLLPKANLLNEVTVSTGYQLLPKERATGAFTVITGDKLNEQAGTFLLNRLDGVASGFSTDRKTNNSGMMIRGLSSISGPRSPLIVLDNFPYEGNLDNLNPNDVESITILKDAAAASIWGARAGNGVIVITTKKGKFNSALQVQAGTVWQVGEIPNPEKLRNIGVADYIAVERYLFNQGVYGPVETSTSKLPLTPVVELLIAGRDGKLSAAAMEQAISETGKYSLQKQYQDLMYRPSLNQQYNLALSSGADKINWNLSLAYDQNRSVLESRYNRLSIKSAQGFKLAHNLMLNTQFLYMRSLSTSGKPDLNELSTINGQPPPYTRLADDAGNALAVIKNYRLSYINSAATAGLLDWNYYPLNDYRFNETNTRIADLIGLASLKYSILKGLDLSLSYQYEQQQTNGSTLQEQAGYATRNLINNYTQIAGTTIKRPVPLGDILLGSSNTLNLHQVRFQSAYQKTLGRHSLNLLAGAEVRSSDSYRITNRSYGYDATLLKSATIDYANTYQNFITGSNSYIPSGESFAQSINNYISFYANGAYTFKEKYTLSASARKDASNLFGLSTNDKWSPLWSAGLAWKISDESFYHFAAIPALKLRASYGLSGNVNPNMSALTIISYQSVSPYTQLPFANYAAYANPSLRWEKSAMLNIGLDFAALKDRLTGSVEYFNKKGTDLYGNEVIDYTTGIGNTVIRNTASMKGNGLDINLSSRNLVGKFKWQSDFFLNIYRDKIIDYYLASQRASNFLRGDVSVSGVKGYPVYSLFSYKWAGLNPANGNPRGMLNGQVSEDYTTLTGPSTTVGDLVYSGSAMPKYIAALGNTFAYGPLSLTLRLSGKFAYFFRRNSLSYIELFTSRNGNADFANRWQKPGDELQTNIPSMVYPANSNRDAFYQGSEATISKGDHIRLQYVNLSYNLKFGQARTRNLALYFMANNLGILWQADPNHIDPDYLQYSPSKTYAIGLRTNF